MDTFLELVLEISKSSLKDSYFLVIFGDFIGRPGLFQFIFRDSLILKLLKTLCLGLQGYISRVSFGDLKRIHIF